MKELFLSAILITLSSMVKAEVIITPELLLGGSIHKINVSSHEQYIANRFKANISAMAYGLRLGGKLTDNFTLELAFHAHGEIEANPTYRFASVIESPGSYSFIVLGSEHDRKIKAKNTARHRVH